MLFQYPILTAVILVNTGQAIQIGIMQTDAFHFIHSVLAKYATNNAGHRGVITLGYRAYQQSGIALLACAA
ncbi:hypothetical protein D3C73_1447810 [compost metagenome]